MKFKDCPIDRDYFYNVVYQIFGNAMSIQIAFMWQIIPKLFCLTINIIPLRRSCVVNEYQGDNQCEKQLYIDVLSINYFPCNTVLCCWRFLVTVFQKTDVSLTFLV